MTHLWREPILRLIAGGPLLYRSVNERLRDEHCPAPLDGQVSKVLRDLDELGYIEKCAGRRGPWDITDRGQQAIDILNHAYRVRVGDSSSTSRLDRKSHLS
jgi:hypothetical protein